MVWFNIFPDLTYVERVTNEVDIFSCLQNLLHFLLLNLKFLRHLLTFRSKNHLTRSWEWYT